MVKSIITSFGEAKDSAKEIGGEARQRKLQAADLSTRIALQKQECLSAAKSISVEEAKTRRQLVNIEREIATARTQIADLEKQKRQMEEKAQDRDKRVEKYGTVSFIVSYLGLALVYHAWVQRLRIFPDAEIFLVCTRSQFSHGPLGYGTSYVGVHIQSDDRRYLTDHCA